MATIRRLNTDQRERRHDLLVGVLHAERNSGEDRRAAIVTFVRDFAAKSGHSPTLREIGAAVGLRTTSAVAYQLRMLSDAGVLRLTPGSPRSVVLIGDPCEHCHGTGRAGGS